MVQFYRTGVCFAEWTVRSLLQIQDHVVEKDYFCLWGMLESVHGRLYRIESQYRTVVLPSTVLKFLVCCFKIVHVGIDCLSWSRTMEVSILQELESMAIQISNNTIRILSVIYPRSLLQIFLASMWKCHSGSTSWSITSATRIITNLSL